MRFTTRDQLKSGVDAPVRDIDGLNALRVPNAPKAPDAFNRGPEVWTHDLFDRQDHLEPGPLDTNKCPGKVSRIAEFYGPANVRFRSDAISFRRDPRSCPWHDVKSAGSLAVHPRPGHRIYAEQHPVNQHLSSHRAFEALRAVTLHRQFGKPARDEAVTASPRRSASMICASWRPFRGTSSRGGCSTETKGQSGIA